MLFRSEACGACPGCVGWGQPAPSAPYPPPYLLDPPPTSPPNPPLPPPPTPPPYTPPLPPRGFVVVETSTTLLRFCPQWACALLEMGPSCAPQDAGGRGGGGCCGLQRRAGGSIKAGLFTGCNASMSPALWDASVPWPGSSKDALHHHRRSGKCDPPSPLREQH